MNLRSVNIFKPISKKGEAKIPTAVAYNTTIEALKPLLTRASDEDLFLRNRHSGAIFTVKALIETLNEGHMLQGPSHWHLLDAHGRRRA